MQLQSAPPTPAPEDLLEQVAAGRQDAMSDLYDLYAARVFGLAVRLARDPAQAEDITQDVFVSIWRSAAQFDPQRGNATSWILCQAHRRAVERIRSSQRTRERDQNHYQRNQDPSYDSTEETVLAAIDGVVIRTALAGLSADHQQVINLAYFDGYTHVQISSMLELPLGTAKSRIRSALLALRSCLSGPTGPGALIA